jgi:hypothetical protein
MTISEARSRPATSVSRRAGVPNSSMVAASTPDLPQCGDTARQDLLRMRLPIADVEQRDGRSVSGRDAARELDPATGVMRAVRCDHDGGRELPVLRRRPRHEHGKRGGVHRGRRGASQQHSPAPESPPPPTTSRSALALSSRSVRGKFAPLASRALAHPSLGNELRGPTQRPLRLGRLMGHSLGASALIPSGFASHATPIQIASRRRPGPATAAAPPAPPRATATTGRASRVRAPSAPALRACPARAGVGCGLGASRRYGR